MPWFLLLRYYGNHTFIQRFVRLYLYTQVDDTLTLAAEMPARSLKLDRELFKHASSLILVSNGLVNGALCCDPFHR